MKLIEEAYRLSAGLTNKPEVELRRMAEQVFGTMLHHSMLNPGKPILTMMLIDVDRFEVEVNFLTRQTWEKRNAHP
jgi:hypothetical protein